MHNLGYTYELRNNLDTITKVSAKGCFDKMGWIDVKSKPATKILIPNNIYLIMAMILEITELIYF